MTEQFSPECIEYLLSDDVLQRLWVPGVGDWSVAPDRSLVPAIVLEVKRLAVKVVEEDRHPDAQG